MKMWLLAVTATCFGIVAFAPSVPAAEPAETTVKAFVEAYDRAFNAKDLDRLAAFYHPDVTIFEGGYVNTGWIDYRDNHLGPELKKMEGKPVDAEGLETLILVKGAEGAWKIRHSHTSSRRKPPQPSPKP